MVGFVVVVLIMAAGVSIAIAHLRWDARIRVEAAKRPIEMTRADYLSQLRNDASWDSQPRAGSRTFGDETHRFRLPTARQVLAATKHVDDNDRRQIEELGDRYGCRDPKDTIMMSFHPVVLVN